MTTLDGKVAIITGAARGQGEAEARLFVELGARVVITDVLADEGKAVAESLGDAARFVAHDVSSEAEWAAAVQTAEREFGRLDVLVNNAAIYTTKALTDTSAEELERILRVNLVGSFLGIKAVAGPLAAVGGGSIVNISSQAGLQGLMGHAAYGASKWGLRGLTKTAALELGPVGIRVNSVHPGPIHTPMIGHLGLSTGPGSFPALPLGRVGLPGEVADLVAFLASDASAFVTGAELAIDGGLSAGQFIPPGTQLPGME
ncbi:glucose 1-dehydrogenase [Nocardia amikacinitolerans]|uniref:glucose 1-dehydrogenase n=1 Tax=Nocardia amikacinitolerans TaxID=756689 RepID=UPI0020A51213|nr:glucose 1-dehydrogenase [Nocardia amikacinitolerans]MCP2288513.1 3alpha(or 20beta)-hydroxysteroid dehydrogenase [Nocardia amikacinitolerans]